MPLPNWKTLAGLRPTRPLNLALDKKDRLKPGLQPVLSPFQLAPEPGEVFAPGRLLSPDRLLGSPP